MSATNPGLFRGPDGRARAQTGGMNTTSPSRRRALRLYALGQALVVAGAAGTAAWHSYLPLALAGSAALMLTAPLVRSIKAGVRR